MGWWILLLVVALRPRKWGLKGLPAVVREGLVGFGHLVRVVLLLHGVAATVGRIDELGGEALAHRLLSAVAGVEHQPAHGQGHAPLGADLDGNLVRGTADAPALNLQL